MFIKKYFLRLSLLVFMSFIQDSSLKNDIPTFSLGYFGSPVQAASPVTSSACVQVCWNKIESGDLYEGAVINEDFQNCLCTVTQVGLPLLFLGNRKNINFLFSIFQPEYATCFIGSYINFRVRVSFYLEGNDESKLYFIDDLNNSMSFSGRIVITRFINLGRSFHSSITTERNNKTKLYSSVKETYSGYLDSKFENFYALETKIGDMYVDNNHTEWAVLVYSTSNSLWVTMTPFTIQRPERKCSLIITVLNYTLSQNMSINFNMTTGTDCVVDLENVTILIEHHQRFKFKRLTWDDLSIDPTSLINNSNFLLIYVQKIYIDSFVKFSLEYEIDTPVVFGQEIISLLATIICGEYTDDKPVKYFKQLIFTKTLGLLTKKAAVQLHPKLIMKNETKFENVTHLCVCVPIKKRQQSPCFQIEKSTGKVIYFPIQVITVIGYDPLTRLLYGKIFRENIIQVDIHKKSVGVVTKDKWLAVMNSMWICMQLMRTSLDHFYKIVSDRNQKIPEFVLKKISFAVISALEYLHKTLHVIHRDVKPSNILVNYDGEIKLCDFGISGHLVDSLAKTRSAGCKPYMAPERINPSKGDTGYDIRSDVWSLGITIVELASLQFPYSSWTTPFDQLQAVVKEPSPRLPPDGNYSDCFHEFVDLCLKKNYRERPKYRDLLNHSFIVNHETIPQTDVTSFVQEILNQMDSR